MKRSSLISSAISLVLAFGLVAVPWTAQSKGLLQDRRTSAAPAQTGDGAQSSASANTQQAKTADVAANAQPASKKEKSFGRALAAPFRALARLFSGSKKPSPADAAKRRDSERRNAEAARQRDAQRKEEAARRELTAREAKQRDTAAKAALKADEEAARNALAAARRAERLAREQSERERKERLQAERRLAREQQKAAAGEAAAARQAEKQRQQEEKRAREAEAQAAARARAAEAQVAKAEAALKAAQTKVEEARAQAAKTQEVKAQTTQAPETDALALKPQEPKAPQAVDTLPREEASVDVLPNEEGLVAAAPVRPAPSQALKPAGVLADAPKALQPSVWTPVIEGVPRDALSQGRALLQHGYVNEAIAELSIAATVGPDLVGANNLLGIAYDHTGNHRQAQEYYERALSVAPFNPEALYNLGHSLYLSGQFDKAIQRLKTAARVSPNDPRIPYSTALVEVRLGKYEEAFRHLALISDPYTARLNLGMMLEDSNLPKAAIKQYEVALKMRPTAPFVLERLAALYDRTGRRNEAEAIRRQTPKPATKTTTGGGG